MSLAGRKQERPLIVFGRYLRVAAALKAKRDRVARYTWTQLARDAGIDRGSLTDAVAGKSRLSVEKVWALIRALSPPLRLEQLICRSVQYCTEREYQEAQALVDQIEGQSEDSTW